MRWGSLSSLGHITLQNVLVGVFALTGTTGNELHGRQPCVELSGHLQLGFSGQALLPSVFVLAAGLCPSLAPRLFCCGYFSLAPIMLRLTPKQTSPGMRRYLAGSDRLVPRLAPGLIKTHGVAVLESGLAKCDVASLDN